MPRLFVALLPAVLVEAQWPPTSKDFPAGWNGLAKTPPMGWRSWYVWFANITQPRIEGQMEALSAKVWQTDEGNNISLMDLGYASAGVDEGWEGCGQGVNGSQHTADGQPIINQQFPDLKAMVNKGHSLGLKVGWYLNGCACGEQKELENNYDGDIASLHDLGFDSVKFDACGAQLNMTRYAALMVKSGRNYTMENCHWGHCGVYKNSSDASSCPSKDWCPFNLYRTSIDNDARHDTWFARLQSVRPYLENDPPLSRPGCWAYPDMLQVGRLNGTLGWQRAHFGAWCIVSSPLVLSLDLTNRSMVQEILPIIANPEAIAVNQQWAGHPGRLIEDRLPPGCRLVSSRRRAAPPAGTVQIWAKPQPGGAMAVLVINSGFNEYTATMELAKLGAPFDQGAVSVWDIWTHSDLATTEGTLTTQPIPATDSAFLLLQPTHRRDSFKLREAVV